MTLPGAGAGQLDEMTAVVTPPGRSVQVVRVLIALGLLILGGQEMARPVPSTADQLMHDLLAERVEWLELTELGEPDSGVGATQEARWSTGGLRDRVAQVDQSWDDPVADADESIDVGQVDVGQVLAAAEASGTPVSTVVRGPLPSGVHTDWVALATVVLAFGYLVAGPDPRLATRWAWWWLGMVIPVAWLALVLVEPVPLWARSAPGRRRLRGGWAFLISLVAGGVLTLAGPDWSGILFTRQH